MPARSSLRFAVMAVALLSLCALRAGGNEGTAPAETQVARLPFLERMIRLSEARSLSDTLVVENYRSATAAIEALNRITGSRGTFPQDPEKQRERIAAYDQQLNEMIRYDETTELRCTESELQVDRHPRRFRLVAGVPRLVPIIVHNPSKLPVDLEWSAGPAAGAAVRKGAEKIPANGFDRFFVPITATAGQREASILFTTKKATLTVKAPVEVTNSGLIAVRVLDESNSPTPTRLYATGSDGLAYFPEAAFKRITWSGELYAYAPGEFSLRLPEGPAVLEFVRGLESRVPAQTIDVPRSGSRELTVHLERTSNLPGQGWFSGDGHIHMSYGGALKMTPEQVILMLQAEDVNVGNMIVANNWGNDIQDRERFEGRANSLSRPRHVMRWNEEYRNPLLGHLILYGLEQLTDPIYSGFARTPHSSDFPLNADIGESVLSQGGFVTGAHAVFGDKEHAIDVALGRMNGIETLGYGAVWEAGEEVLHALWNCGFRTVATAGTDSFLNMVQSDPLGGARSYAKLDGEFSYDNWLAAVRAGRTFVTNAPMLFLSVDGEIPGADVRVASDADQKGRVRVNARASSPWPLTELLVYFNGDVVGRSVAVDDKTRELVFDEKVEIPHSGWISARVTGPHNRLVFGIRFFPDVPQVALTSPVWITLDGRKMPPSKDARRLLEWVDAFTRKVEAQGRFADDHQRQHMREVYGEARRRFAQMVEDYEKYVAAK